MLELNVLALRSGDVVAVGAIVERGLPHGRRGMVRHLDFLGRKIGVHLHQPDGVFR
jgi:hypothetical protein